MDETRFFCSVFAEGAGAFTGCGKPHREGKKLQGTTSVVPQNAH
jgi:hypothetical protein